MEKKYDPYYLLTCVTIHFEAEEKIGTSVTNEELAKYRIEIGIKDKEKLRYLIAKVNEKFIFVKGAEISGTVMKNDELEKNKDNLGTITIMKNGKEKMKFQSYEDFWNHIGR